jgi:hypothetical protein
MRKLKVFAGRPDVSRTVFSKRVHWLILLFLFFSLFCGLYGEAFKPDPSQIEIVSSYFGAISRISDPKYDISVIKDDMTVDTEKWREMCRRVSNNGASAIRMMPFWPPEKESDIGYMPYAYLKGKFDLNVFNEKYFQNLTQMVKIANSYGLRVYFSMYEACGMRNEYRQYNPWYNNHQQVQDFRHIGPVVDDCRANWEQKIYKTLEPYVVYYEICNEPKWGEEALFKVYKRMLRQGIQDTNIVMGVEWDTTVYRQFRNLVLEKYGEEALIQKKHLMFSVIHGITEDILLKTLAEQEGHRRRYWLSPDGLHPKPTAKWWEEKLTAFFKLVPTAAFKNMYAIETMHKIPSEDDFDSAVGISKAIFKHTGKWPKNYGKFPKEEPSTILVKSPNGGEAWQALSTQTITWTTTGTVGSVTIDYSTNNGETWTTIIDAAPNNGSYAWTLPDTSSDSSLVKVYEVDGDPVDTGDAVFKITKTINNCEPCFNALWKKLESKGLFGQILKNILEEIINE